MSKKKRDERRAPAPRRGRPWWPLATALIAVAGTIATWVTLRDRLIAFPAPPTPSPSSVSYADFVGAETCRECHAAIYDAWSHSTHGRAGGLPTRQRVIAPFDGRPIQFRDAAVTPSIVAGGGYLFTVVQPGQPPRRFHVDAVVGGGFMAGGGTQAFFSRFPDGTARFLPFDYSKAERRWFCNTLGRGNLGSVPITPAIALADCADWPPYRILGTSERYQGCQQCHGSQISVAFDTTTRAYETKFTTLAINCESCHGPGRRHVDLARAGGLTSADIGLRSLATLAKDQSLEVCFQCHAVKTDLKPRYLPGEGLQNYFALKLPMLVDSIYFPDGRIRAFAYQEGHLSSDCYLNGSMTCVDCHDPHTQRYRDVVATPLPGRFDDGQCLDCHPSKGDAPERHTHHPAGSAGSRCVACHMPYLQEPNVGPRVRYARSDHTIPIPRPLFDSRLGVENACSQCHRDRTVQRLDSQVTAWYGRLKPHQHTVATLLTADSTSDAAGAARAILAQTDVAADPMAGFAGLAAVLERYARPDMRLPDGEITERLQALARDSDPDVQALALATLHLMGGDHPAIRRFLVRRLRALGRDGTVRDRWVRILEIRGDTYLTSGDYLSALAAYRKAGELQPDDPVILRSLGVASTRLGHYPQAIDFLRRSLAVRRRAPQVLVELGFALMQQGDVPGAVAAYEEAIADNPSEPAAYANLGVAELRRGEFQPAIDALTRAVALDPSLADANFALATAYAQSGRLKDARSALERGLEFEPGNAAARQALEGLPR